MTSPLDLFNKARKQTLGGFNFSRQGGARMVKTMSVLSPKAIKLLLQRRRPTAAEVREVFESLGVTYIKLGQVIASSPSIFSADYVEEFQKCLDKAPVLPFNKIKSIIEAELEGSIDELFDFVNPTPLAAASIAQVHSARLKTGEDVVIKVQKPDVHEIINTDLNFVFIMTRLAEWVTPGLSQEALTGFITELYCHMIDECDFIKEANNLEAFKRYLSQSGNRQVVAPKPYREFSTSKVLTMQRLYGKNISEYSELPADALMLAMNTWFDSLLNCEFFHADLHGGNLMLLDDGTVGFIDFGMVSHVPKEKWNAIFQLFTGLTTGDAETMASAMLIIGMTKSKVDKQDLINDIKQLMGNFNQLNNIDARTIDKGIDRLLIDMGQLARDHGLRFPHGFTLLIKQFMYFDRYINALDTNNGAFFENNIKAISDELSL